MPEAIIVCVAMICLTVFITLVTIKGMDYGLIWTKERIGDKKKE